MNTNNNMLQFMQMIRSKPNPQQFLMDMLGQQSSNNPFFANLYDMARHNNTQGLEQVARNLVKERGLDFDTEFNSFKQMFGL